jgi:hypothetical protein
MVLPVAVDTRQAPFDTPAFGRLLRMTSMLLSCGLYSHFTNFNVILSRLAQPAVSKDARRLFPTRTPHLASSRAAVLDR